MVAAERRTPESNANTVELVRGFAKTQPHTRALVDMKTGRALTFAEFADALDVTAASLRNGGVTRGDRVALFVATGIELSTVMFACFQVGAIPVLIDPGMGVSRMLGCIREQQPRALIGVAKAHVLKLFARASFASVGRSFVVGGGFPGAIALPASRERDPDSKRGGDVERGGAHVERVGPDDVAAILFTSGSTGAPKGVVYTHAMFTSQARAIRDMFDIKPGEVDVACFLPFAFFSISMGMTAVFPDMDFRFPARADPLKILGALRFNDGAQSAFASPTLWEPFSRFLDAHKNAYDDVRLHKLRRVLTAGAPVSPSLHERLLRFLPNGDVFTPYGATEALPVAFMSGRDVVENTAKLTREGRGTCVGKLAPDVEVRIIAVTDAPIASMSEATLVRAGTIGEIVVCGPCITRAYDNDAANRASKIKDGNSTWHRMGDCGHLDDDGRLWFCGRKAHRVDKAGGVTLHSIPIEAVVEAKLGFGDRAALVGVGVRGMQRAVVVVEFRETRPRFVRADVLARIKAMPGCADVDDVLPWFGAFPVDRRHNAKIEREQLAEWAAKQLGSST
jgi:acyl-CoA synthetase (AMP-forming)/AMP-acid ligase II